MLKPNARTQESLLSFCKELSIAYNIYVNVLLGEVLQYISLYFL